VPWRKGAGNDETVWEAPGYEIPFVEVSRCRETFDPFPEYHSSLDTVDRLDEDQVEEYACLFREAIAILERDAVPRRRFDGLPCLSNPRFDLYVERPDPALPGAATSAAWGRLQDHLPRHLDGARSLLHLAEQFELPFEDLLEVMQRWRDKGLVDLAPARLKRPAPSRAAPRRPRRPAP
jgi:aminopeptidase-like protein